MTELYILGYKVDLGTVTIAQTYQINDLAEIKDRQTNFTNAFTAPPTPNNIKLFNFLGIDGNTSRMPYKRLSAVLIEDGFEVMPKGYAQVKSFSAGYKIVIYDGVIGLAEALADKTMNDSSLYDGETGTKLNHESNNDTILNSLDNTSGYIHAFADFGDLVEEETTVDEDTFVNTIFQLPYNIGGIFLHTLIENIFLAAGLEVSGNIFNDSDFKKLIITPTSGCDNISYELIQSIKNSSIETNPVIGSSKIMLAESDEGESITLSGVFGVDSESDLKSNDYYEQSYIDEDNPDLGIQTEFNFSGECTIEFYSFSLGLYRYQATGLPSSRKLNIKINSETVLSFNDTDDAWLFNRVSDDGDFTETINVNKGDVLTIEVEVKANVTAVNNEGYSYFAIGNLTSDDGTGTSSSASITQLVFTTESGNTIYYEDLMPETTQINFLKDFMQHYGAFYRINRNGVVEFKTFEELLNDFDNAEDWSDKYVSDTEDYTLSSYAKSNTLEYDYDDEDDEGSADGTIEIDNEHLDDDKTMFTSIYSVPEKSSAETYINSESDSVDVYKCELYEEDDDIESPSTDLTDFVRGATEASFMLWQATKQNKSITIQKYIDEVSDDTNLIRETLSNPPFLDPSPCNYQNYVDSYYPTFKNVFDNYKKRTVYMKLSPSDIYNLDFFKLKYIKQLGRYFYLNKVKEFNSKTPTTKCELIEIPVN